MQELNPAQAVGTTQSTSAEQLTRLRQQRIQEREQQAGAAAESVPVAQVTPEQAGEMQQYYNRTLEVIGDLRGKNYTMPSSQDGIDADTSEPADAAKTSAAGETGTGERSLEAKAKDVVTFNMARLNEQEKSDKPLPPLPMEQANDNFKTVIDYIMKSPEANSNPAIKSAMQEDVEKAKALYKKAGDAAMPFPVYLAQIVGQDDRIPQPLALSAIDFTRSFGEFAK